MSTTAQLDTDIAASPADPPAPCNCWETINTKLAQNGVKLSDKHRVIGVPDFEYRHVLLLEGLTVKLKRGMPATITMSYCPFCGHKYKKS